MKRVFVDAGVIADLSERERRPVDARRERRFHLNGYTERLFPATFNSDPLAGQTAFAGEDDGSTGGTWSRSIVNLAPYAHAGDTIQIRFDLGHDACSGRTGGYVDDVSVFRCR